MLLASLSLALLALLDGCAAAVLSPTHGTLGARQTIEDIVNGMNATENRATLLSVNLSKDKQYVGRLRLGWRADVCIGPILPSYRSAT